MGYSLNFCEYLWQGTKEDGSFLRGEVRAPNCHLARAQLLALDIFVLSIRRKILFFCAKTILKTQTRIQMTEQLADLLSAGVSMTRSLSTIENICPDPRIKTLFWLMNRCVESGQSFGNALDFFPKEFSPHYRQLVQIGETSGQLEVVLCRLATLEKKTLLIQSKLKKASFYPGLVFFLSTIICGFLLIGIVPKFIEIFDQAKISLPETTCMLINASKFLIAHGATMVLIFFCFSLI